MTTAELTHRKRIVRAVIGSQELEGVPVSAQTKRVLEEFARGHIHTTADLLAKVCNSEISTKSGQ